MNLTMKPTFIYSNEVDIVKVLMYVNFTMESMCIYDNKVGIVQPHVHRSSNIKLYIL